MIPDGQTPAKFSTNFKVLLKVTLFAGHQGASEQTRLATRWRVFLEKKQRSSSKLKRRRRVPSSAVRPCRRASLSACA
jgi:hypothetical protein